MKKTNLPKYLIYSYAALLVANVIWSAANPVIKLTLQYIPLFSFLFLRFSIVCLILLPFVIMELKKNPVDLRDVPNIILLGIFDQTAIVLVFAGLKYTTSLDGAIIGVLAPLLAIAAGHYFYKEKIDSHIKTGVILATLGTLFIVIEPILVDKHVDVESSKRLLGNILVLLYTLSFLVYIIWLKISLGQKTLTIKRSLQFMHLKPMRKAYPAPLLTALSFYVALAIFTPLVIFEQFGVFGPVAFTYQSLTLTPILGVLYMALLSSIVAYMCFNWALKASSVGDTAIFGYLAPIFTLPFAYVLLGEKPTPVMLVGAAIIAVGVVIAERKKA